MNRNNGLSSHSATTPKGLAEMDEAIELPDPPLIGDNPPSHPLAGSATLGIYIAGGKLTEATVTHRDKDRPVGHTTVTATTEPPFIHG